MPNILFRTSALGLLALCAALPSLAATTSAEQRTSLDCASSMRSSIDEARSGLGSLDRMPKGADFRAELAALIGQFSHIPWESATAADAPELAAQAEEAVVAVNKGAKGMAALGRRVQNFREKAANGADPKAWAAIQEADDEVAAGTFSIQVMGRLTLGVKRFASCIAG